MKKILLLILAGTGLLVACSKDDSFIIIGCAGGDPEYIKEQVNPQNHDLIHEQNEIMKISDPGIH